MATLKKEHSKKQMELFDKKLKDAQVDFKKLMEEVEPFIKKSEVLLTSTEGKWYDTTITRDTVLIQNSYYR